MRTSVQFPVLASGVERSGLVRLVSIRRHRRDRFRLSKLAVQGLSVDFENRGGFGLIPVHRFEHRTHIVTLNLIKTYSPRDDVFEQLCRWNPSADNARLEIFNRESVVVA